MNSGLVTLLVGLAGSLIASESQRQPVILELFTSQGCSSCPAAEALIEDLDLNQPLPALELIPLVYHVDYWDQLGWRDPYASAFNTKRQYTYARQLDQKVYTPQAMLNGSQGLIGYDRAGILSRAKGMRTLELHLRGHELTVRGMAGLEPLWVALTQDAPKNSVSRGENAGRELTAHSVVMALLPIPVQGSTAHWKLSALRADHLIAFQQADLGPIVSAARLDLRKAAKENFDLHDSNR